MELGFWNDPETGMPHIYEHGVSEENACKLIGAPEGERDDEETTAAKRLDRRVNPQAG
jgi:hypothetical protein